MVSKVIDYVIVCKCYEFDCVFLFWFEVYGGVGGDVELIVVCGFVVKV